MPGICGADAVTASRFPSAREGPFSGAHSCDGSLGLCGPASCGPPCSIVIWISRRKTFLGARGELTLTQVLQVELDEFGIVDGFDGHVQLDGTCPSLHLIDDLVVHPAK